MVAGFAVGVALAHRLDEIEPTAVMATVHTVGAMIPVGVIVRVGVM